MKSLKELVLEAETSNKVVFIGAEGLMQAKLDEFIKQPVEGLLYDLNRDRATVLSWIDDPEVGKFWINNFATMLTITKLKEYHDFYDSVACLIAKGSEFMTKAKLYDAIKKEHGKVK